MSINRRARAAIILVALWGFASGVLMTALGAIIAQVRGTGYENVFATLWQSFVMGAEFGMVIGAGFAGVLALRGERTEPRRGKVFREIVGSALLGAVLGTAAFVMLRAARGVPLSALLGWPQILGPTLIMGGIGGIVGPGILAIARRGKELPTHHESPPNLIEPR